MAVSPVGTINQFSRSCPLFRLLPPLLFPMLSPLGSFCGQSPRPSGIWNISGIRGRRSRTCSPVTVSLLSMPKVMALGTGTRQTRVLLCLGALPGGSSHPRGSSQARCSSDICWLLVTTRPSFWGFGRQARALWLQEWPVDHTDLFHPRRCHSSHRPAETGFVSCSGAFG